jgi:cell division protein FtsI/penicillin-binding protein 2
MSVRAPWALPLIEMKSSSLTRTRLLLICMLAFAFILIAKLFLIQIIHKSAYTQAAERQYATPAGNIFERNTIYFTTKTGALVSAATQASGFKIAINPTKITDDKDTYEKLNKIVPITEADFLAKAGKKNDPYEEVAFHLSEKDANAVSALKLPGVTIFKEKWRAYPAGKVASQTLGILGYQGDTLAGRYGLEREYDKELTVNGGSPYVNFFAEVFSNIKGNLFSDEHAGDIVTTIEPTVDDFLLQKLGEVENKFSPDQVGGIIMNPTDGSIYALESLPNFNPNDPSTVKKVSTFSNPVVENVLEFGSIVKPLVMAAAIDQGLVNAGTTYTDKGSVVVENKEIFNFDKKGRGPGTTMQDVLTQSLNTGMVFVYQKLGKTHLRDYLLSYGIDDKTGIDLPNESSGLVSNIIKSPRDLEYANASFGQGIAFTPLAMIRALASLGNGGKLVTPHLVKEIRYQGGLNDDREYTTTPVKISEATAKEITRMLVQVMDKGVKGGTAKLEHWSVAVKTGTAQVANTASGGYYEDRHTHSFFGYFPAYDPKFIVLLYAVNPKGVNYAVETWADPFVDITKFLLNYYEVPPDR